MPRNSRGRRGTTGLGGLGVVDGRGMVSVLDLERSRLQSQLDNPYIPRELFSCVICATDDCLHAAVGWCDHPVCTVCMMRLRTKNKDKGCAMCKQEMGIVVVVTVPPTGKLKPFAQYEVKSSADVQPGMEYDHPSGMVFIDCRGHYRDMENMRSAVCPLAGCGQRFPSESAMVKHIKDRHGQSICPLCLEHQSLFVSEHRLMSDAQLKAHLKAPGKDGHPLCQFCDKRFFDAPALYRHMRAQHETCPLCPAEHQHRFYATIPDLDDHMRAEHYPCTQCREARVVAFATHSELSSHMLAQHNVRAPSLTASLVHRKGNGGGGSRTAARYLDLDVSSDDPTRHSRVMRGGDSSGGGGSGGGGGGGSSGNSSGNGGRRAEVRDDDESIGPLIPANYRIAGSITGAGTFARNGNAAAIEAASASAHEAAAERLRRAQSSTRSVNNPFDFPSLAATNTVTPRPPSIAAAALNKPHPLSIFHAANQQHQQAVAEAAAAKQRADFEETQRRTETDSQQQRRNQAMAEALGLGVGIAPVSSSDPLSAFLRRPLYTQYIIQWARKPRGAAELPRIEKTMAQLVHNPSQLIASAQFKPMDAGVRTVVHMLARYYGLTSREFDPEPRRYVSLLRTVDSAIPAVLLSVAAVQKPVDLSPLTLRCQQIPLLYFSILNGYFQRLQPGGSSVATSDLDRGFSVGAPTVALLVTRVRQSLSRVGLWRTCSLAGVQNAGPSGLGLEFHSIEAANAAYLCLKSCEAPVGGASGRFNLLDLFEMDPAFEPVEQEPEPTAPATEEEWERAAMLSELQGVNSRTGAGPLGVTSAAAFMRPQQPPKPLVSNAFGVPDDWFEEVEQDTPNELEDRSALTEAAARLEHSDAVGAGERKPLDLKPRSLPPPLPPMLVKKPPARKATARPVHRKNDEVPSGNSFAFLSNDDDDDDDDSEDEEEEEEAKEVGEDDKEEEEQEDAEVNGSTAYGGDYDRGEWGELEGSPLGGRSDDLGEQCALAPRNGDNRDAAVATVSSTTEDDWQQLAEMPLNASSVWRCLRCTFENDQWEAAQCRMCGSDSSDSIADAVAAIVDADSTEGWISTSNR